MNIPKRQEIVSHGRRYWLIFVIVLFFLATAGLWKRRSDYLDERQQMLIRQDSIRTRVEDAITAGAHQRDELSHKVDSLRCIVDSLRAVCDTILKEQRLQ